MRFTTVAVTGKRTLLT